MSILEVAGEAVAKCCYEFSELIAGKLEKSSRSTRGATIVAVIILVHD